MFNIGVQEMALIGVVALVVIGPERLPRVARTAGALFGRAQRYVAEVKAEVNRAVDLDELRHMKQTIEEAGRDVEQSVREVQEDAQRELRELRAYSTPRDEALPDAEGDDDDAPTYRHPGKKWRLKRSAVPQWYKARAGVRRQVQSGAARVARYRPRRKP